MCGFRHSTFLTTPVTETGLVLSLSGGNEWCARRGGPVTSATSNAATAAVVFTLACDMQMLLLLRVDGPRPSRRELAGSLHPDSIMRVDDFHTARRRRFRPPPKGPR